MNRDFFICPSERVFLFAFLFFTPNQYKSRNVFLYVFVFSIFKVLILSVNNEHHTPQIIRNSTVIYLRTFT